MIEILLCVLAGLLVGLALGFFGGATAVRARLSPQLAAVGAERDHLAGRVRELDHREREAASTREMLAPLASTLRDVRAHVSQLERDRVEHFGHLGAQLHDVATATVAVRNSLVPLTAALHSSSARGTWGETQLKRVVEHAGMLRHCDFTTQTTVTAPDGSTYRPDLVVQLPRERHIVVDAKAPLQAYLTAHAAETPADQRGRHIEGHAAAVRAHVKTLASKKYWEAFTTAPELVVCFLPADAMLSAALDTDPALFDDALASHVVLATPSTLLAMLRTVAVSWHHDAVTEHARDVLALGKELHQRCGSVATHLTGMGTSLRRSVESYNKLVGSIENRVLVTARKMSELSLAGDAIPTVEAVESTPRGLTSPELLAAAEEPTTPNSADHAPTSPLAAEPASATVASNDTADSPVEVEPPQQPTVSVTAQATQAPNIYAPIAPVTDAHQPPLPLA